MFRRIMAGGLFVIALALLLATPGHAEILRVEPGVYTVITEPSLPLRGQHQAQVIARHGEPVQRFATVAGDRPQHPPITRWDFDGFSVVFEGPLVLHSVVHGPQTPQTP